MTQAATSEKAAEPAGVVITQTTTTTPVDVEKAVPGAVPADAPVVSSDEFGDPNAGKGLGIAMFVLLIVALIFTFIPWLVFIAFICTIIVIIFSSVISCSCCCASDYNLRPETKKYATATLASLCLMFIVQVIYVIVVYIVAAEEVATSGTVSANTSQGAGVGGIVVIVLSIIFNIAAIIFSALFTWKRPAN